MEGEKKSVGFRAVQQLLYGLYLLCLTSRREIYASNLFCNAKLHKPQWMHQKGVFDFRGGLKPQQFSLLPRFTFR